MQSLSRTYETYKQPYTNLRTAQGICSTHSRGIEIFAQDVETSLDVYKQLVKVGTWSNSNKPATVRKSWDWHKPPYHSMRSSKLLTAAKARICTF